MVEKTKLLEIAFFYYLGLVSDTTFRPCNSYPQAKPVICITCKPKYTYIHTVYTHTHTHTFGVRLYLNFNLIEFT